MIRIKILLFINNKFFHSNCLHFFFENAKMTVGLFRYCEKCFYFHHNMYGFTLFISNINNCHAQARVDFKGM